MIMVALEPSQLASTVATQPLEAASWRLEEEEVADRVLLTMV